ncbi:polysaccharide deacetylase family protein [Cytophagaceae bacterium ABcell3]|nr:polysaccharide deacetylase family protein [Cytophagaceae bacterium ABcell3]
MLNFRVISILLFSIAILVTILDIFFVDIHYSVYILILVFYSGLVIGGAFLIGMNFFVRAVNSFVTDKKEIALTFDDGPSALYTPKVLDLLNKYDAKGTFFCIGKSLESERVLAERILKEGHLIGNHTYGHSPFFPFYRKKRVVEEISRTNNIIQEISGKAPLAFRPPYGITNPSIAGAINHLGMKVFGWNIRSFDTTAKDFRKVVKRVTAQIKPGAIILLHDNRPDIAKILEEVLLFAEKNNYRCTLIPHMQE